MMLPFNADADLLHILHHLLPKVLLRINRRSWEVTFFVTRFISKIWPFTFPGIPDSFGGVNVIVPFVLILVETNVVEDKKFWLRTKIGGVSDTGGFEIGFRFASDVALDLDNDLLRDGKDNFFILA